MMAIQIKAEKRLDVHSIDKHLSCSDISTLCTSKLAASLIHFLRPSSDSKTSFNDNEYS